MADLEPAIQRNTRCFWMGGSSPPVEKLLLTWTLVAFAVLHAVSTLGLGAAALVRSGTDLCRKYIKVTDTSKIAITI